MRPMRQLHFHVYLYMHTTRIRMNTLCIFIVHWMWIFYRFTQIKWPFNNGKYSTSFGSMVKTAATAAMAATAKPTKNSTHFLFCYNERHREKRKQNHLEFPSKNLWKWMHESNVDEKRGATMTVVAIVIIFFLSTLTLIPILVFYYPMLCSALWNDLFFLH